MNEKKKKNKQLLTKKKPKRNFYLYYLKFGQLDSVFDTYYRYSNINITIQRYFKVKNRQF